MTAFLLALLGLVGVAGIHRFYTGKVATGILWLVTGGLFGVGTVIDIIRIAVGGFPTKDGQRLQ
ncbi:NINE protein [Propionimicrobium lymphophilum]|nr:NINE protein [Propionimicrobium lymphophilum]MDK7709508.1 NINE protein [Propionimicrobium lymphophilum]